jgi:hypothetical protein
MGVSYYRIPLKEGREFWESLALDGAIIVE